MCLQQSGISDGVGEINKVFTKAQWTVRNGAIKAILDNYEMLLQVPEEVHTTG